MVYIAYMPARGIHADDANFLKGLTARERQVALLYINENLSSSQIAIRLGLTHEYAKKMVSTARKHLADRGIMRTLGSKARERS
jgi:DNA-directed RNA polymerase specialized sigma24 family protein